VLHLQISIDQTQLKLLHIFFGELLKEICGSGKTTSFALQRIKGLPGEEGRIT